MNETKNENANSEIAEVDDLVLEEGDDAEVIKQKVADYKTKVDERNAKLFARAKKAEGFELKDGKWIKPQAAATEVKEPKSENTLTQADVFTLVKNNIEEEDVAEIVEYAKLKNITIAEALKSNVVKTILAEKVEQRKVAEGTDTGGGRRGNARVSDETIVSDAMKGKMPESEADMIRLIKIRKGLK